MLDGVLLRIFLNQNNSMLVIQRNLNTTFILLVFSLLGTVVGVLGAIKAVMVVLESRSGYFLEKRKKRQAFQNMLKTVGRLSNNFEGLNEISAIQESTPLKHSSISRRHEYDDLLTSKRLV
jgi:hypothetical protein